MPNYRKPVYKAVCGKVASVKGKPFNKNSLNDHQYSCSKCREIRGWQLAFDGVPLRDMIGNDEPDGAYWAMPGYLV